MQSDKSDREICISTWLKALKWKLGRDEWNDRQKPLADLVASKFSEEHCSACRRAVRLRSGPELRRWLERWKNPGLRRHLYERSRRRRTWGRYLFVGNESYQWRVIPADPCCKNSKSVMG